jgi:hypothetical protein
MPVPLTNDQTTRYKNMAITQIEYTILSLLKLEGIFPENPNIIEFGESNWYGDIPIEQLREDLQSCENEDLKEQLIKELDLILKEQGEWWLFDLTKIFYKLIFNYKNILAIDLHGTDKAYKIDLNQPIEIKQRFNISINIGTGEHIFNIYQFFKTIHDITLPQGIMIHCMPFSGWYDHGFFNLQPTFYWDLAKANDYQIITLIYTQSSPIKLIELEQREDIITMAKDGIFTGNSMIFAVFQKSDRSQEFKIPMQGYYSEEISEESQNAWRSLR